MRFNQKETLVFSKLLAESPWFMGNDNNIINNRINGIDIEKIKTLKSVGSFNGYRMHVNQSSDNIDYYLLNDDELILYCRTTIKNNGIILDLIWNNLKYKGLFRRFLIEYLLLKFPYIESGDTMTQLGFNFWKNLMDNYPQYNYFVLLNGNKVKINDSSDFENYKEPITNKTFSTFAISK